MHWMNYTTVIEWEESVYGIHTNGIDLQRATFNTTGCLYHTQAHVLALVANTQVRALRAESWRRVPFEQPLHITYVSRYPEAYGSSALSGGAGLPRAGVRPLVERESGQYSRTWRRSLPPLDGQSCEAMEPRDAGRSPTSL